MRTTRVLNDMDGLAILDPAETQVLGAQQERLLLRALAECKAKLAEALTRVTGNAPEGADDPQSLAHYINEAYAHSSPPARARLGAIYHQYEELRGKLALANMRLVAHVAKRFRDRGVAYSDLLQEGFCGLLEAIDRFDLSHETKLSTYATWWIRQAIQRAVAAGAYPVRLSPRHLRQLAQNQDEVTSGPDGLAAGAPRAKGQEPERPTASAEMIQRIHAATRPTISLDASVDTDSDFSLLQTMSDPEGDRTGEFELGETLGQLMQTLPPREQQVLSLRFGLGGGDQLSLSQVGEVLEVSKERVRQIQDRALSRLRSAAAERASGFHDEKD